MTQTYLSLEAAQEYFENIEPGYPNWLTIAEGVFQPRSQIEARALLPRRGIPADTDFSSVSAAVNGNSVLSLAPSVSSQQKDDILLCTRAAEQAADRAHTNRHESTDSVQNWYHEYSIALREAGWSTGDSALVHRIFQDREFRMDEEALNVIRRLLTGSGLSGLMDTLAALESTPNDDQLSLFESHSSSGMDHNFILGSAEVADGALTMTIGYYYFKTMESRRRFLFLNWESSRAEFWASVQRITLSQSHLDEMRERIRAWSVQSSIRYYAPLAD